jgi:hypothetical protein
MVNGNKIAEAYVEIRARMDKLEADFAAARNASAQTASQMDADAKRSARAVEQGSDDVEQSLKRQAGAFTSLLGRIAAVTAAMVSFHRVGQTIRRFFVESAEDRAEGFLSSIASLDMATRLSKVTEEIDQLNARAEAARETFSGFWSNVLFDQQQAVDIEAQVKELIPIQSSLREAIASQNRIARQKERRKEVAEQVKAYEEVEGEIQKVVNDNQQAIRDSSAQTLEQRERDAKAWADAEKAAAEEAADHIRRTGEETRAAQKSADEQLRRSHEAFTQRIYGNNAVDIRRLERAIKFASLNGRR